LRLSPLDHAFNVFSIFLVAPHSSFSSQGKALVTAASGSGFAGWVWEDRTVCDAETLDHPLSCYFSAPCRRNDTLAVQPWQEPHGLHFPQCAHSELAVHDAGAELLFARLAPRVLALAEAAAHAVFGPAGAPRDMIAVHLRWGDKGKEMELVPVQKYVEAVERLALKVGTPNGVSLTPPRRRKGLLHPNLAPPRHDPHPGATPQFAP
jgi:hypothetical protein